ncbi:MAG: ribulose-phosphate 3-epimerase [Clostridia bacterium]|nr:ribulose-phosphate 3-epimerase [Clostridia bacterium]
MIRLSPSLLSLDFYRAKEQIEQIKNFAPYLHFDVMDGHFVPNLALGECIVKSLRPHLKDTVFDVHLMVEDPEFFLEPFANAGADIFTFHVEAVRDARALIERIHALGLRAGISLKPKTPVDAILPYLDEVDLVLVMTVEPGFGGQALIPECLEKITVLREEIDKTGRTIDLEVDGGIKAGNVFEVTRRGADLIVAGSAVFGASDPRLAAETLLTAALGRKHENT